MLGDVQKHSVHPLSAGGRGVELPNFQKGVLDRTSAFRGDCSEIGGEFFQAGRGFNFHTKKKTKNKYLMTKKFKQKYFLCRN